MNKIKILPPLEAAKIAAGEVVERPANILKELLENAIDAGSSQIVIHVEEAGKKLLRVVDNGCGMSLEDIRLSIVPHATSKIASVDDLVSLATYGFRGEALASIAAVSRLVITSCDDGEQGWRVVFGDEGLESSSSVATERGTDVEVHDLFYNIPARKKFLKQDETEWNQLQQLIFAFALSNLNVSFKVFHNGRLTLQAPAVDNLKDRIAQIWDVAMAQQFLDLEQGVLQNSVHLKGVITNHQMWRYGKHQIFFFVNNRLVKDVELVKALCKGYNNVLPPGKFPAAVIMISIDPAVIDVNVHPKKEEVRFAKPQLVSNTVMAAVQDTLRKQAVNSVTLVEPELYSQENSLSKADSSAITPQESFDVERVSIDHLFHTEDFYSKNPQQKVFRELGDVFSHVIRPEVQDSVQSSLYPQKKLFEVPMQRELFFDGKLVGQILNTYLVVERSSRIVFIDQHAAHERILYEQMKDQVIARQSSMLIFPQVITMNEQEIAALDRYEILFANFGLKYDCVGYHALAVKATPLGVAQIDLVELLKKAAALIIENDTLDKDVIQKNLYEHVHSHLACKRAVKAGDILTNQQMEKLLQDLKSVEKPFICIHGRPTYWQLEQKELERRFQR